MISTIASKQKLRTRNIHDGGPVPPIRSKGKKRNRGYSAAEDRYEVIICKHGFLDNYDKDHYGWFVGGVSTRRCNLCLNAIVEAGGVVLQRGDSEAAGKIKQSNVDAVLKILAPWKRRKTPKTVKAANI